MSSGQGDKESMKIQMEDIRNNADITLNRNHMRKSAGITELYEMSPLSLKGDMYHG